jgi:hypothetical protein
LDVSDTSCVATSSGVFVFSTSMVMRRWIVYLEDFD